MLPTTPSSSNADRAAALNAYAPYAHNHVTGTKVSWSYNEATAKMTATYAFTTTARQGSGTGTVYALYPHQRDNLAGATLERLLLHLAARTDAGRGRQLAVPDRHDVQRRAPAAGQHRLRRRLRRRHAAQRLRLAGRRRATRSPGFGDDTYWTGKAFGRAAQVAHMANLTGNTAARDTPRRRDAGPG